LELHYGHSADVASLAARLAGSIGTEREIDAVFAKLAELQAGGLVIGGD
jgi:hypothetical protein